MSPTARLAIFDLDGTLMQTSAVDDDCYARAMAEVFGIVGMSTDWGSYSHSTDGAILGDLIRQRLRREPTALDAEALRERFVQLLAAEPADRFRPTPGAAEAIAELRRAGWMAAIATGGWQRSARLKLGRGGLEVEGLAAAFADDALSREEIILLAMARAHRRDVHDGKRGDGAERAVEVEAGARRAVYVGDGVWDLRAANALGLGFVGVARGERAARLRDAGARIVLPDLADATCAVTAIEREATLPP
ncbi:MAG: haloacid dehalogenase-like hydrolase [Phycisphaerales bacterium]|jgi:phosphoglycolate phosphatase-like HAD superfamily hydrolase